MGLRSEVLKEIYEVAVLPKMVYTVNVWDLAVQLETFGEVSEASKINCN